MALELIDKDEQKLLKAISLPSRDFSIHSKKFRDISLDELYDIPTSSVQFSIDLLLTHILVIFINRHMLLLLKLSYCWGSVSVAQLVNATVHATGTGGQTTLRFSSGDVWFAYKGPD